MLSLAHPLWLWGLLLLPLVRWLHRGGPHRLALPVARLALWQRSLVPPAGAGRRQPPDPAWRRRALLLALLLAALAGPQWPAPRHAVTLWVDDSISMLTREDQGVRLSLALQAARQALAASAPAEVELRALGAPWRAMAPDAAAEASLLAAAAAAVREPAAPPAALLTPDRQHWLLTDGADPSLLAWPGGRGPDRLIVVAAVSRNLGLRRLAVRRSADAAAALDLQAEVVNGGTQVETRTLVVEGDGVERARAGLRLEPGATGVLRLSLPTVARLRARLQPADALAADDELALDLAALGRRPVAVDPGCPAPLRAAVDAHPGLQPVAPDRDDAVAALECGRRAAPVTRPTLRVHADGLPLAAAGVPAWSDALPAAQRPRLDALRLPLAARLQPAPGDRVLLALGAEPAIVERAGRPAPLIETGLDADAMAAAGGPELPLLANLLFERLLGSALLDPVAGVERDARAARVAAPDTAASAAAAVDAAAAAPPAAPTQRDGATRALLLGALLVLLWEIGALVRQGRRQRLADRRAP